MDVSVELSQGDAVGKLGGADGVSATGDPKPLVADAREDAGRIISAPVVFFCGITRVSFWYSHRRLAKLLSSNGVRFDSAESAHSMAAAIKASGARQSGRVSPGATRTGTDHTDASCAHKNSKTAANDLGNGG